MRLGQLGRFRQEDDGMWTGLTTREIFDNKTYCGQRQSDAELIGKKVYQVEYQGGPVNEWFIMDRNVVKPTGLIMGEVASINGEGVYITCSEEWTNSETFKTNGRYQFANQARNLKLHESFKNKAIMWRTVEAYDLAQKGFSLEYILNLYPSGVRVYMRN